MVNNVIIAMRDWWIESMIGPCPDNLGLRGRV
jgi:hypothetical protein